MKEIIVACVLFLISVLLFLLSFRSFREKGILFNNAWIYASEEERKIMNKKPHYRQTAIVFLLLGVVFAINSITILTGIDIFYLVAIGVVTATVVYAVVSSVKTEKK